MKRALYKYMLYVPQSVKWSEHGDLGIEYSCNGQNIVHVLQANCPAVFSYFSLWHLFWNKDQNEQNKSDE